MLANPVVIPAYATPEIWAVALLAMWAEIKTETVLLRQHVPAADLSGALLLLNIVTWLAFLIGVEWIDSQKMPLGWGVAILEVCVVVAESLLIWIGIKVWSRAQRRSPLRILHVVWVALAGNIVSICVSLVPVAVVRALL